MALLEIDDLAVAFGASAPAVDGLDLAVERGQVAVVVGESGCGKSVTALSILRLVPSPGRIERGRIRWDGRDLLQLDEGGMQRVRGGQIAMIFQEPMTALNPVMTVGEQIVEAVCLHRPETGWREAREVAAEALASVEIAGPRQRLGDYPHELSGGMRQRVMIAMSLACRPRLLLAVEPTTALDVSVGARILDLLDRLRSEHAMSILLITHDLGVVAERADVVTVMYAGRAVEQAPVKDLFAEPLHPYTRALLECRPRLRQRRSRLPTVGDLMSDRSAFELRDGAVAWWPAPGAAGRSSMREVEPAHHVRCWLQREEQGG